MKFLFLRTPCFVSDTGVRTSAVQGSEWSTTHQRVVRAVFEGGATLESVTSLARDAAGSSMTEDRLGQAFSRADSAIASVEIEHDLDVDIVLVEQGYGGVYVHTVELLKKLRRRWKCLLLSPVRPLFEPEPMADVLTLEDLREKDPSLDYFAWFQIVRSIVKRARSRLLLITHRSQSLFLFDLLADKRTVIYCDGFYDAAFRRVQDFRLDKLPGLGETVLREIHYLVSNSAPSFYGIQASPGMNAKLLAAGGLSLQSAVENWCWGVQQHRAFVAAFTELAGSVRLMLPFTNPELFREEDVQREPLVLFTTTMHNIEKKGFPELVKALGRLPSVRVRCVVRQPERLAPIPASIRARMEIGPVEKPEMVRLYHRTWVNFRTSREESSPLSILEGMVCELPQIVSPRVAEQIPILEDGATGFVVDPDDCERQVWALRTLLGDRRLRDHMGRECRRRAETLSFERRVCEFERLLA